MCKEKVCFGVGEVLKSDDNGQPSCGVEIELVIDNVGTRFGVHCPHAIEFEEGVRCGAGETEAVKNAINRYDALTQKLPTCYQLHPRIRA